MIANIKERPILFNAEMVRAILSEEKTQTRRVMKPQPEAIEGNVLRICGFDTGIDSLRDPHEVSKFARDYCPKGQPNDQLWVRESFWQFGKYNYTGGLTKTGKREVKFYPTGKDVIFEEPETKPAGRFVEGYHKRPSIFMPRWSSRIQLEITDIRVERLNKISEEDAMAEGVDEIGVETGGLDVNGNPIEQGSFCASFCELWNYINEKRGYSWDSNPFVWVIEFRKIL